VFAHGAAVNWLAAARLFLFGSRDVWFAVALPLFLAGTLQWPAPFVGAFLSAWVIGYGVVQAAAPVLLRTASLETGVAQARWFTASLVLPLAGTVAALRAGADPAAAILLGLCLYGVLFAVASSVHSWLVVGIADAADTPERVGFYYAANAAGRLVGTLASGWLFATWSGVDGLCACLAGAAVMSLLALLCTLPISTRLAAPVRS
jgi:hypothetical protein